jgi:hypothetical protein
MTRLVFLVPGFFGFTTIGSVSYFHDVEHSLSRALGKRGIDARIVHCPTQPTGLGSPAIRAAFLTGPPGKIS